MTGVINEQGISFDAPLHWNEQFVEVLEKSYQKIETVYLAGNISGGTLANAKTWRDSVSFLLTSAGYRVLDPLRDKFTDKDDLDQVGFGCNNFSPEGIFSRDLKDVTEADFVLAYLTDWSFGTIFELGFAFGQKKQNLIVLGDQTKYLKQHPFVLGAGITFDTLWEAVDYLLARKEKSLL